jgi:hypothetical protein
MKRLVLFTLLMALSVLGARPASAQIRNLQQSEKQNRKAQKQQEKYFKKAAKKQQKFGKKSLKVQKKAEKKAQKNGYKHSVRSAK